MRGGEGAHIVGGEGGTVLSRHSLTEQEGEGVVKGTYRDGSQRKMALSVFPLCGLLCLDSCTVQDGLQRTTGVKMASINDSPHCFYFNGKGTSTL